ncbi:MAG: adenosylcobinamide-phosphate synthase CbiB, partial [Bacilli bacterium]
KNSVNSHILSFIYVVLMEIIVILITFFSTYMVIEISLEINHYFGYFIQILLCYYAISPKALKVESMKVYNSLKKRDIKQARKNLSYIVGRDTENLNEEGIIKATIETIAENLSDGVIAPLLYIFIGGVPLGLAYKAINTLDSMVGYRNETYEYFGKFSARVDDIANFIPSRISALLMIAATCFTTKNTKNAFLTYRKYRYHHNSPNSAQTESVCAGALKIELGGPNYYNGKLVYKESIGTQVNTVTVEQICSANKLMYVTSLILILLFTLVTFLLRRYYV